MALYTIAKADTISVSQYAFKKTLADLPAFSIHPTNDNDIHTRRSLQVERFPEKSVSPLCIDTELQ